MRLSLFVWLACVLPAAAFDLKPGDRVCIVGNTLADRMQHDGQLETYLHATHPKHNLVVRNLGFSGDEITTRLRSAGFGSPDEWLTRCRADVVFVFFGYNESFAGDAGLPKFRADLAAYLQRLRRTKYNGESPPRVVLFSPVRFEPVLANRPDADAANARLEKYTAAMKELATQENVAFVDLFRREPAGAQVMWTFNGIHLNDAGWAGVTGLVASRLFNGQAMPNPALAPAIRAAVNDKNFHWFNRYRTTDGYSIFGGRADLKFIAGQTNREVAQREMDVLDVMTANRDKAVWAAARGESARPDDTNLPAFIPVLTNKPGAGPNGAHLFLGGEEAIRKMTLGKGLVANLFASEEQFPELINPVQMTWDARGRLWVAVWPTYPHWKPTEPMNDKILVFEDTNADGKADKMTVFADGLHNPTGFELYGGGVIVANCPDLIFLKDTDGDGKADFRERVLHGLDSADTHHAANSLVLDPGGALYMQEGTFHHTQVETPWGPPLRNANAGVFRFEPRSHRFETYVSYGFANPHGHAFDRWGQDIVVDGTGSQPYHAALFSGFLPYPQKHPAPPQVYQQRTRPCPGIEYVSSRHFPDDWQGNLLVGNVIGFQGVLRYRIDDDGASLRGTELEPVVNSTDPNFRPSDIKIGPDGAIYVSDWQNPIIGHMQHNLRDPSRDRKHGRIYRIAYDGRPLTQWPAIVDQPVATQLDLLKQPEDRVRYRTRAELGSRPAGEVIPALDRWLAGLDKADPGYEHHRLEGLWVRQWHDAVNEYHVRDMLASPDFRVRAATVRVLCYQRHHIPAALEILKAAAADEHPRVRLEAVRAASFFTDPTAIEVVAAAAELPSDRYLDFVRIETLKVLDPLWKSALAAGRPFRLTTDAGRRYMLRNLPVERLMTMDRTPELLGELLTRPGVSDDARRNALRDLAKARGGSELRELVAIMGRFDAQRAGDATTAFDLVRLLSGRPASQLAEVRGDLERIALTAGSPALRQAGYVALVSIDGSAEKAWAAARISPGHLADLLNAVPQLNNPAARSELYPRILDVLQQPPAGDGGATRGQFVRVELPGRSRTLSLAEVEVLSGGVNVARRGKASQKNTSHGGDAKRAVDGRTTGSYESGTITHSAEGTSNPWWEVDLGAAMPIESVTVWNRTDGSLGQRLAGYTLIVLDDRRREVFRKENLPAPVPRSVHVVAGPGDALRRAAMNALVSVRGKEATTFATLAKHVVDGSDREAAVRALQRLPRADWPKDRAGPLIDVLARAVGEIPAAERTSGFGLDALELADALASLLPAEDARRARARLSDLGVRVVRIGSLPERMAFDKETIAVQAGKPIEFVFDNVDLMPHNFVIIRPGSLEAIGAAAEATATDPTAAERQYVPKSDAVLRASRLLQPGQTERISFVAPSQPGVYPFVCTYPGHWRTMHGALYVVADLEAYQANPEGYVAANPVRIEDPMLKDRRPRTEWKFDDLAEAAANLKHGRSYAQGKELFKVANCHACHKLEGVGQEYGPNLTEFDAKWTPLEVWKEMVDPSARINEKYQSYVFQLASGKTVTGLIVRETADALQVAENPIAGTAPIVLKKDDVEAREKSPTSLMPKGLLDKLSREEILDLLAYVTSRGRSDHPLFQPAGHGAGGHGGHGVRPRP